MSYAQRKEIGGNRTVAIVIVALIHAVLGYAIVTGLAYNVIKKAAEDLKTFNVEEEPPPPPEEPPPPPPENMPETPPPVVSPPPIVRTNTPPPLITTVREAPPPVITPRAPTAPPAPPAPPPPPPVKAVPPRSAVGNLQNLFRPDDYPVDAAERGDSGTTRLRLSVGSNGRVSDCDVTSSSGSRVLDRAACRVITSRARYTPARDSQGNPTSGTDTVSITWRLAD